MHEFGVIVMRCLEKHPADFANYADRKRLFRRGLIFDPVAS